MPRLPPAWAGLRIAHLTDLHLGRLVSLDRIDQAVTAARGARPDLAVVTGDLVTDDVTRIRLVLQAVAGIGAPFGVLAAYGNHDARWARRADAVDQAHRAGVELLVNDRRVLRRDGAAICVAGVADPVRGQPDLQAALAGVPAVVPRILLCHNPDYAEALPGEPRVDLMLSGHTHGGQVRLPLLGPPILPIHHRKYAAGLVRGPRCPVYVSRGIGVIGLPVRLNCRPELALLTLQPA